MLLTDYNSIYIGSQSVKEAWLNGVKLYPEEASNSPFDNYSWAEIQAMVQNETANTVFTLGDEVTLNCGTYGSHVFRLVDFEYNGYPTMVLICTDSLITDQKYTTRSSGSFTSYTSSYCNVNKVIKNLVNSQLPVDLRNVLVNRTCSFMSGTTSISSSSFKGIIPAIDEISDTTSYYRQLGTGMLAWFEQNMTTWQYPDIFWTRSRHRSMTGMICTFREGQIITNGQTSQQAIVPMIFIG